MRRLARVLQVPIEDLYVAAGMAESTSGAARIAEVVAPEPEIDDSPLTPEEEAVLARISFMGFQTLSNAQLREIIRIVTEGR
jgi:hypothetical protein